MQIKELDTDFSVSGQIQPGDIDSLKQRGVRSIVCNRPDGEGADQPVYAELQRAAEAAGLRCAYLPVTSGAVRDEEVLEFTRLLAELPGPVHAYCRSGMRSTTLWALSRAGSGLSLAAIVARGQRAGYDLSGLAPRIAHSGVDVGDTVLADYDVLIVGGGAAGIACASSLRERDRSLSVALIDPAEVHYYQPGWTFVGAGIFAPSKTARTMASLIPSGVDWIRAAVAVFDPERNMVVMEGCRLVRYRALVVAAGLKLDWDRIEGLPETLGRNGVSSNYRYDLAPYTWKLVQELRRGRALFTQPPMPIKCAGAPQKAMYLSSDHWLRRGHLTDIQVEFHNAGAVLFGVADYVPALMRYVERYGIALNFGHNLVRIDGESRTAWFQRTPAGEGGEAELVERQFDMIHVVPPQLAPDFVRASPLADDAGWVDVDPVTLQHRHYENIWALGDVMNAPNAKTAAAARKQAPVVANNVLQALGLASGLAHYDGYGSCPLTVERGKIVLAEFGYGGKLLPSMPKWLINGTEPSRLAWYLKEWLLPPIYWRAMLRGREWLARPVIGEG
jgi:sulfide:quinone oxidoreductase